MIVTIKCFDTACGGANGLGGNYESFDTSNMSREAAEVYLDNLVERDGWVVDESDLDQALYGSADVKVSGQCPPCAAMAGD